MLILEGYPGHPIGDIFKPYEAKVGALGIAPQVQAKVHYEIWETRDDDKGRQLTSTVREWEETISTEELREFRPGVVRTGTLTKLQTAVPLWTR